MSARRRSRGFTLVELVVAITIGSIVLIFVTMFIVAPVDAYEAHGRRALLVADAGTAWPRIRQDLGNALPNSVRWVRNGNLVALEMLQTCGYARYAAPPSSNFLVAGTASGVFGGCGALNGVHLSVNNPGAVAYTQTVSMTPAIDVTLIPAATPGEATVQLAAPPLINTNSPRSRVYVVTAPVSYLCDEGQGTLRRYSGYPIAAAQPATPAALGGAGELVARGLSNCSFSERRLPGLPQSVAVQLTTTRANESVRLLHTASLENLP